MCLLIISKSCTTSHAFYRLYSPGLSVRRENKWDVRDMEIRIEHGFCLSINKIEYIECKFSGGVSNLY